MIIESLFGIITFIGVICAIFILISILNNEFDFKIKNIKMKNDFKKELVDDQDGIYTMNIKYHCWYGWITIKVLEHPDLDYLNLVADEILDALNSKI